MESIIKEPWHGNIIPQENVVTAALLSDAPDDVVRFLVNVSYAATEAGRQKNTK